MDKNKTTLSDDISQNLKIAYGLNSNTPFTPPTYSNKVKIAFNELLGDNLGIYYSDNLCDIIVYKSNCVNVDLGYYFDMFEKCYSIMLDNPSSFRDDGEILLDYINACFFVCLVTSDVSEIDAYSLLFPQYAITDDMLKELDRKSKKKLNIALSTKASSYANSTLISKMLEFNSVDISLRYSHIRVNALKKLQDIAENPDDEKNAVTALTAIIKETGVNPQLLTAQHNIINSTVNNNSINIESFFNQLKDVSSIGADNIKNNDIFSKQIEQAYVVDNEET